MPDGATAELQSTRAVKLGRTRPGKSEGDPENIPTENNIYFTVRGSLFLDNIILLKPNKKSAKLHRNLEELRDVFTDIERLEVLHGVNHALNERIILAFVGIFASLIPSQDSD